MSVPLTAYMLDNPKIKVGVKELQKIGVLYWHFDPKNYDKQLDAVKKRRGYTYQDTCLLNADTPDLEKKKVTFFEVSFETLLFHVNFLGTHPQGRRN
jgi:hypothetical protein